MTLADLNTMDRAGFVDTLGRIFEHSPWVAERAWRHRPFATVAALHAAMVSEVETARPEEQLALLRAHPDLGTRAHISAASTASRRAPASTGSPPRSSRNSIASTPPIVKNSAFRFCTR